VEDVIRVGTLYEKEWLGGWTVAGELLSHEIFGVYNDY